MPRLRLIPEQLARDLHFAARSFRAQPVFSLITVLSLALGLGGSTAMYSVIYGAVLHPFIYRDVDRLVSVQVVDSSGRSNYSYYSIDQFLDIAEHNRVFSGVIASTWSDVTYSPGSTSASPQRLRGNHCTPNTFSVMGVPPLLGRTTTAADTQPDAEPVVILGYKFWQQSFAGDPSVIGRRLRLNDKIRTVIGVMPPRFMWRGADVYLPDPPQRGHDLEGETEVALLARLRGNITPAQAAASLRPVLQEIATRQPDRFPEHWQLRLRTFTETFPNGITEALWILFGAVGLLLLIACVNVSNLLLAFLGRRQKEFAIRSALGASRLRLIRQLLTESLLLALAGGLLGSLVAYLGLRGILSAVPANTIPDEADVHLNAAVLLYALALSFAVAVLIGVTPAFQFSRRRLTALHAESRSTTAAVAQTRLRGALVVGEVGLCFILLTGAILMLRTLYSIQSVDVGLPAQHILSLRIPFSSQRYLKSEARNAFFQQFLPQLAAIPGVSAVGLASGLPPIYAYRAPAFVDGMAATSARPARFNMVNPGYAPALALTLQLGRFLSDDDMQARRHNAVVNQAFLRSFSVSVGQRLHIPMLKTAPGSHLTDDSFQIVGVIADRVTDIATGERSPEIYIPYTLLSLSDRVYLTGSGRPEIWEPAVRRRLLALDAAQPITDVHTVDALLSQYVYAQPRFNLLLFAIFATLGLVMALLGIYGVIAGGVSQRTREIGLRVALGAQSHQVMRLILNASLRLLAIGIVLGLLGSWATARFLHSQIQHLSPLNPLSLAAVGVIVLLTGVAAAAWPAWRAGHLDPTVALRHE